MRKSVVNFPSACAALLAVSLCIPAPSFAQDTAIRVPPNLFRTTDARPKVLVPFKVEDIQEACYTRG
jgi:hypothetical protein